MLEDRATVWRDLDRLEEWADRNLTKQSTNEKVQYLGRRNLFQWHRLGDSSVKKDPWILLDTKLNMSHWYL